MKGLGVEFVFLLRTGPGPGPARAMSGPTDNEILGDRPPELSQVSSQAHWARSFAAQAFVTASPLRSSSRLARSCNYPLFAVPRRTKRLGWGGDGHRKSCRRFPPQAYMRDNVYIAATKVLTSPDPLWASPVSSASLLKYSLRGLITIIIITHRTKRTDSSSSS